MNLPAGFKPNPNLDKFIGNLLLDIITLWNFVTTEIQAIEPLLVRYVGVFGLLGASF